MSQPVIEPNFEGEEMKIPEGMAPAESPAVPTKSVMSVTVIALLTITLIAIFAGLGYWYNLVMTAPLTDAPIDMSNDQAGSEMEVDPSTEAMSEVSNSDELEAIEADVEATNLNDLDRELAEIDAELDAEMGAQ